MTAPFKKGDRVVCVDSSEMPFLVEGKEYVVFSVWQGRTELMIDIKAPLWMRANRFRLVVEPPAELFSARRERLSEADRVRAVEARAIRELANEALVGAIRLRLHGHTLSNGDHAHTAGDVDKQVEALADDHSALLKLKRALNR